MLYEILKDYKQKTNKKTWEVSYKMSVTFYASKHC